jgi:hypothetical protein
MKICLLIVFSRFLISIHLAIVVPVQQTKRHTPLAAACKPHLPSNSEFLNSALVLQQLRQAEIY